MRHFPIYLDTRGHNVVVSGAGDCAVGKLRLILKTEATVTVYGANPDPLVVQWAAEGRLTLHQRDLEPTDLSHAVLFYAASADLPKDRTEAQWARARGVKTLIVDNLDESDFIMPAIVDRDPVTVAIGTEGAAPVLARRIKAEVEEMLPQSLGTLARLGKLFRPMVTRLPFGRARREFWSRYYFDQGPKALNEGEWAVEHVLNSLLEDMQREEGRKGHVHFVGAGPGDPELMTLKARKLLHDADVVIHDRLVPQPILELARREATIIEVGKIPFGPSWKQDDINALLQEHGKHSQVVRLKSGDCGVFGRLDEETEALDEAGIEFSVVPGVTSAMAAAAELGVSLTRRGRNAALRIITGHEADGFAEQDWRALAEPGATAAIYMGKAAASFLQGRLLMHGADAQTPVTIVENASRPDQRIVPATLLSLPDRLGGVTGPAVLMLGLAPHAAQGAVPIQRHVQEAQ